MQVAKMKNKITGRKMTDQIGWTWKGRPDHAYAWQASRFIRVLSFLSIRTPPSEVTEWKKILNWTLHVRMWAIYDKMLSCRKETVRLLSGLVLAKWKTIVCGHYRSTFNHCDVFGLQSYRIRRNNAKLELLRRSRSFKVTDFGTYRKPLCNFLLVINSNWHPIW